MPLSSSLFAGGCAPSVTVHPSDSAMPPQQCPEIEIAVGDVPTIGDVTLMGKYMDDAKRASQTNLTLNGINIRCKDFATEKRSTPYDMPLDYCKRAEDFKCLSCRSVDVCHCVNLGLRVMAPRN